MHKIWIITGYTGEMLVSWAYMLSRMYRLKRRDVEQVFANGRSKRSRFFMVKWTDGHDGGSQFCVAPGKKIAANAVARNRVKRQIRAMLYDVRDQVRPGVHCAVVVMAPITREEREVVVADLRNVLQAAKLLQ